MIILVAIFALIVSVIVIQGYPYYLTPLKARFRSPLHRDFKPGGHISHPLGIAGSVMLIGLLSYSVRKRARFMRGRGKLSSWLIFHIFLGLAAPVLITLHSAFKLRGIVAISYWSMIAVVISGMIGRYLYAQIPRAISGAELMQAEIRKELEELNAILSRLLDPSELKLVQKIADFHTESPPGPLRAIALIISDDLRSA